VKKIKKFKLKISPYLVEKKLKEKSYAEILPEIKKIISEKIEEVEKLLLPATVYETFKPEQIFPRLSPKGFFSDDSEKDNCVSLTIYVIVLGEKTKFMKGDQAEIYQAIIESAQEQARRFVYRLVNEEAKKENYLLGMNVDLPIDEKTRKIFKLIDFNRLGLGKENIIGEQIGFCGGFIPWLSKKKIKTKKSD
jgi:hypothetical protein